MFIRYVKHIRPMVCKLNQNALYSKWNIPVAHPWRCPNRWGYHFREPLFRWRDTRDIKRQYEEMWRGMERMMHPRNCEAHYVRPREADAMSRTEVSVFKYDSKCFELKLDVQQFSPSELNVQMVGNRLIVSGKHEQKADEHGYVSREFHREVTVPENVNLETMTSSILEEGFITIRADIKGAKEPAGKVIDIQTEAKSDDNTVDKI